MMTWDTPTSPASSFRRSTPKKGETKICIVSQSSNNKDIDCRPLTHGAEENGRVVTWEDGLKPHAVPGRKPELFAPLLGHPLRHGHCADAARLGHHDVAVGPLPRCDHAIQNKLGNLEGSTVLELILYT